MVSPVPPAPSTDVVRGPVRAVGLTAVGVAGLLEAAHRRLHRLGPNEAADALFDGALLADILPREQRLWEGGIPGAQIIERNVLEWRLDRGSEARIPEATSYDLHLILFCSEGYATSLAAVALQDLGLRRATDLVGGFHAWAGAGLPVNPERAGVAPFISRPPSPGSAHRTSSVPLTDSWPEPVYTLRPSSPPRCLRRPGVQPGGAQARRFEPRRDHRGERHRRRGDRCVRPRVSQPDRGRPVRRRHRRVAPRRHLRSRMTRHLRDDGQPAPPLRAVLLPRDRGGVARPSRGDQRERLSRLTNR